MLHSKSGPSGHSASAARRDHIKPEAEQAILGGLMLDNRQWPSVANTLTAADFHRHDHRLIFSAIHALAAKGAPFDIVTLGDYLEDAGTLDEAGGLPYLGILARDTPSAVNTPIYARIVKKASLKRQRQTAYAGDNHDLAAAITDALKALDAGLDRQPRLLTVDEVLARSADYDWLIAGLIERQQSGVLWGDTGTLKTLQAIDIACRIATGTLWNGCGTRQGGVLYIVGEGAGRGITRRLKAWQIKNGIALTGCPLIIREVPTTLPSDTATLIADTKAFLEARGWTLELVILDTLSRTMDGDENSQSDFGAYQRALDQIRAAFGCATLFLHHSGHADKDRPRGASSITCNADVSLAMHAAPGDTVRLSAPKLKDAGKPADMFFRLVVIELDEIGKDGKPITSVTLMPVVPPVETAEANLSRRDRLAFTILQNNGPMLIGDWRAQFRAALLADKPGMATNAVRNAWYWVQRNLVTTQRLVVVENNMARIANGPDSPSGNDPEPPTDTPPPPADSEPLEGVRALEGVRNTSHLTPPLVDESVRALENPYRGSNASNAFHLTVALADATAVAPDETDSAATGKESTTPDSPEPAAYLSFRSSEQSDIIRPSSVAITYWFILKDGKCLERRFDTPVPLSVAAVTGRRLYGDAFSHAQIQEVRP